MSTRTNRRLGLVKGEPRDYLPGHFSKTERFRSLMADIDPETTKHVGPDNGQWKGGRYIESYGYVLVRVSPGKTEREHRVVAEREMGRPLRSGEVVHHINGDRADNRWENLEVLASQSEHAALHMDPETARRRGQKGGRARVAKCRREGTDPMAALRAMGQDTP